MVRIWIPSEGRSASWKLKDTSWGQGMEGPWTKGAGTRGALCTSSRVAALADV